eukprot:COSAG02_NODE_3619_length_6464_cov_15.210683_7_plen_214_part_00
MTSQIACLPNLTCAILGRSHEYADSSKGLIGTLIEVYKQDGIGKLYSGMQPEITRGCLSAGLVRASWPHPCGPTTLCPFGPFHCSNWFGTVCGVVDDDGKGADWRPMLRDGCTQHCLADASDLVSSNALAVAEARIYAGRLLGWKIQQTARGTAAACFCMWNKDLILSTCPLLLLLARFVSAAGLSLPTTVEPLRLFELYLGKLLRSRGHLRY